MKANSFTVLLHAVAAVILVLSTTEAVKQSNLGGNEYLSPTNCGQSQVLDKVLLQGNTLASQYPWMVALGYKRRLTDATLDWRCGGVLINSRYVLTSAVCTLKEYIHPYNLTTIRLGEHNLITNPDCRSGYCSPPVQDFSPEDIIVHPAFNSRVLISDDIALIRLDRNAQLNPAVQPICLPPAGLDVGSFLAGVEPIVTGWGRTEHGTYSEVLKKVELPFVPLDECRKIFGPQPLVNEQVCFGGREGQGACLGDSGGPLFTDTIPATLLGIVSYGPVACGSPGVPDVYTNVASYRNWVVQNIKP